MFRNLTFLVHRIDKSGVQFFGALGCFSASGPLASSIHAQSLIVCENDGYCHRVDQFGQIQID